MDESPTQEIFMDPEQLKAGKNLLDKQTRNNGVLENANIFELFPISVAS
jgi:hypothetical protein